MVSIIFARQNKTRGVQTQIILFSFFSSRIKYVVTTAMKHCYYFSKLSLLCYIRKVYMLRWMCIIREYVNLIYIIRKPEII